MKVLIMGGAGMIGQKLLNLILSKKKIQNQDKDLFMNYYGIYVLNLI